MRLYEKELIYRGTYLVNWCPRCGTAISDLEVEHEDEASSLWYIRYPVISDEWSGPQAPWPDPQWCAGGKIRHGGHHPPRDDAGRYGRGRASGGRAVPGPDRG